MVIKHVPPDLPAGCGNHGCKIAAPAGMGTNGPCRCRGPLIALVGEAPGQEEIEDGRPFVGPAGRILNALLSSAGIDRAECLVTNVFDWKLANNDLATEKKELGGGWAAMEAKSLERLAAELHAAKPKLVVALGDTAMFYLTKLPFAIGKVRGAERPGAGQFEGLRVFGTYHPSFVQRQPKMFSVVVVDLVRAKGLASTPAKIPDVTLHVKPTVEEVEEFCIKCKMAPLVSVDIETGWGTIRGVSLAPSPSEAMYIPFHSKEKPDGCYWETKDEEARAWAAVISLLENPKVRKLGQNFGNYDLQWLLQKMGVGVQGFTDDLLLLHKSIYPELPAGLAFMAGCYSSFGPWKAILNDRTEKIEE